MPALCTPESLALGLLVVLLLLLVGSELRKETMTASPRARRVAAEARLVFDENRGRPAYQEYKKRVAEADPVQFDEVRELFRAGALTPKQVEPLLA